MRLRRHPPALFASLWIGALCMLGALAPAAAQAAILEVQGVQVDVTADSAAEARERAILEAQRKAFEQLAVEVTGGRPAPGLSDADITGLVHDFSITDEKSSTVRYIATFDVRFDSARVRDVVGPFAASAAAAAPRPVVIVPLLQSEAGQTLWDEPNPWRTAWARHASSTHVVPTLVPAGDLEDVALVGPEDAAAGDTERLMALARHHGAEAALVAIAAVQNEEPPSLTVTSVRHGPEGAAAPLVATFAGRPEEPFESLLDRAAAAVHADLQARWRQETVAPAAAPAVLDVAVPITGLNDWIFVRGRLQNQQLVKETDLIRLSREEARLVLHYVGELSELTEALRKDGLDLVREGERWTLLPTGVAYRGAN